MAEIDKSLPNDKLPDEVAEEVDVTEIEELKGPVEITEDDEGATIDLTLAQCLYQNKAITLQT